MERETIKFDVVVVGAGPAGLSTACRLKQLNPELTVCVLEKGSEVGAHIISGALFEPKALTELFPDWQTQNAPVTTKVADEEVCFLGGQQMAFSIPEFFVPQSLRNNGHYIISLANLCRWLGQKAEVLGVEIFPGFAGAKILYDSDGKVSGVITGDMGISKDGKLKPTFQAGMEIHATYTVLAEGCHGHLGKTLIQRFSLGRHADPQHYGLAIKEIWHINPAKHRLGDVLHTFGWPLDNYTEGGGFLYHIEKNQLALGFITALNYRNPHLNPYEEMQRWKLHPKIKKLLEGGTRIAYGARAVNKGGLQSLPQLSFPGGMLVGCDAGFLNPAKLRGIHTAIKSGMLAAETIAEAFANDFAHGSALDGINEKFQQSWLYQELYKTRNFSPALNYLGNLAGGAATWLDQNALKGQLPFTLHRKRPDSAGLRKAGQIRKIAYPKPDGVFSFDILSSVALSNTNHEENQPCHLMLTNEAIPINHNLAFFDEPAQRYCPAKVYEIIQLNGSPSLQINSQNCLHCKTCDIKDPAQNINWVPPEGGGGPNYANM